MKEIPLNNSPLKAIVDDEDFEWLNQWSWGLGNSGYVRRSSWDNEKKKSVCILMHRFIMGVNNKERWKFVDHVNRNKMDYRRSNLRFATPSQSVCNAKIRNERGKTSRFKGVTGRKGRWIAYLSSKYHRKHLGVFKTEKEAAKAYNAAAGVVYGEYCSLNPV